MCRPDTVSHRYREKARSPLLRPTDDQEEMMCGSLGVGVITLEQGL